jgi:MFS family permease
MRVEELVPVERPGPRPTFFGGIREGLGYAAREPRVRTVLVVVAIVSTVGFNFHVILPLLASDTLHTGPEAFGLLSAAFGGGALVGALLAATLGRASWKLFLLGLAGFSGSLVLLAPVRDVLVAAVLLFVTGIAFTLWTSQGNSILQLGAPDHLRGRVVSLFLFAFAGLAPLGGLLAGWLVDVGGTELSFAVAGVTGLGAVLYAARSGGVLHRPNVAATTT